MAKCARGVPHAQPGDGHDLGMIEDGLRPREDRGLPPIPISSNLYDALPRCSLRSWRVRPQR